MKIDAHQHFWDLNETEFDYSWTDTETNRPINRSFLPEDLKPHLDQSGIDGCVFVQTQHNTAENHWVLNLADPYDWIFGVVGWVDLASPNCEEQLLEFKDHPKFVGVRHVTQDEPDNDFIVRPDVIRGLKALEKHQIPFDLLFYVKHLHHVQELGRQLPELPMVINHLSKPDIKNNAIDQWKKDFVNAAEFPNVYCKLSGMITEADWDHWKPVDLKPYIDLALEQFGPERCMYGSDWPVCELAGTYGQVHDALAEFVGTLSESEQAAIWSRTAIDFYSLKIGDSG